MAADLRLVWTLGAHGWAECLVADAAAEARVVASCLTPAPESLLTAVARLVAGEAEAAAQFEAEPAAFRWVFRRDGGQVSVRLLELSGGGEPDRAGTELWSTRQPVDGLARAVVRCFDAVAGEHGEDGYLKTWGAPFPRTELEALRRLRRPPASG